MGKMNDAADRLPWKDQSPVDKVQRGIKAWVTDPVANQAMRDYLDDAIAEAKQEERERIRYAVTHSGLYLSQSIGLALLAIIDAGGPHEEV